MNKAMAEKKLPIVLRGPRREAAVNKEWEIPCLLLLGGGEKKKERKKKAEEKLKEENY